MDDWNIARVRYVTSLRVDIPHVWAADPDLAVCARQLRTALSTSPLRDYAGVTLVAHSMGGLVVQRAILDDPELAGRLAHVVLYGTPSGGLRKATAGQVLKRQFRDMGHGGPFVNSVRKRWAGQIGNQPPFDFVAVAASLTVMNVHPDLGVSAAARDFADRALSACEAAPPSPWREATRGAAQLVLGNLPAATAAYSEAAGAARSVRDRESMYAQAVRVADQIYGAPGVQAIEVGFGVGPPEG